VRAAPDSAGGGLIEFLLFGGRGNYTWRSLTNTSALGVRGARKSVDAIKAATTNRTVVKKPKTF
jgi:hypothetical protein